MLGKAFFGCVSGMAHIYGRAFADRSAAPFLATSELSSTT
jgi:hypothetical protein